MSLMDLILKIDKFANSLIGGDPRETISSRMARNMHKEKWAYIGCRFLEILLLDKNHCEEAKQDLDNLKTNDHPLVFAFLAIGIVLLLVWVIHQIANLIG